MSRSLKKAPFVEAKLYKRITAMNESGSKQVIKTWSDINSVSLLLREPLRVTQDPRPLSKEENSNGSKSNTE